MLWLQVFATKVSNLKLLSFGEVGLSGEVRSVSQPDIRVREAIRMGFTNIILPAKNLERLEHFASNVQIHGVRYLSEALKIALN